MSREKRARVRVPAVSTRIHGRLGPLPVCPRCGPAVLGHTRLCPKPSGSTSCPGRLALEYECPQGRPAQPGDSGRGSIARGVDQLFRVTRARVRGPTGSSGCPARLRPVPEGRKCRPALPGDLGPHQRACGVDQPSWATQALARGPAASTSSPGQLKTVPEGLGFKKLSQVTRYWVRRPAVLTSCPGPLGPMSEGLQFRPALPHDSNKVRGPAGSTSCPGRFHPLSSAHGVDKLSRVFTLGSEGPWGLPAVPGDSGPGTRARGRPASPGDLGPGRTYRGFLQMSRATRTCVRGPAGSTTYTG